MSNESKIIAEGSDGLYFEKEVMNPHFTKYHIKGLPFDAALHHFTGCDPNEDFHDHPWSFTTHILKGGYWEESLKNDLSLRAPGTCHTLPADHIHRIILLPAGDCWTLVLPQGKEKESGFYRVEDGRVLFRYHFEEEYKLLQNK